MYVGRIFSQNKKQLTIISDISQGGLKMMDFEIIMNEALKIAQIKRINEHVLSARRK